MKLSSSSLLLTLSTTAVLANPLLRRQVDNTQSVGTNPITKFTATFLGNQISDNSCVHRDLGFTGQVAGKWYAIYGDNLYCAAGVTDPNQDTSGFHGMVRDAVAAVTDSALKVQDLNLNSDKPVPHPQQFVPFNANWGETNQYGFGGTSLCATNDAKQEGMTSP
jgi:hypothetical protein